MNLGIIFILFYQFQNVISTVQHQIFQESLDVLTHVNINQQKFVTRKPGSCESLNSKPGYSIHRNSLLKINLNDLKMGKNDNVRGSTFEFSILLTVLIQPFVTEEIFYIQDENGEYILSIMLGREIIVRYKDTEKFSKILTFSSNIDDGKWNNVAFIIQKSFIKLYINCSEVEALWWSFNRTIFNKPGKIVFAEKGFKGLIENFWFMLGREAAYKQCEYFINNCDLPSERVLNKKLVIKRNRKTMIPKDKLKFQEYLSGYGLKGDQSQSDMSRHRFTGFNGKAGSPRLIGGLNRNGKKENSEFLKPSVIDGSYGDLNFVIEKEKSGKPNGIVNDFRNLDEQSKKRSQRRFSYNGKRKSIDIKGVGDIPRNLELVKLPVNRNSQGFQDVSDLLGLASHIERERIKGNIEQNRNDNIRYNILKIKSQIFPTGKGISGKKQIKDDTIVPGITIDLSSINITNLQLEKSVFLQRLKRQVSSPNSDEDSFKIPSYVPAIGAVLNRIFSRLEILDNLTNDLQMKFGTKGRPARTCKDIYLEYNKNVTSNLFWLDPNQGSKIDAFLAECKFKDNEVKTCISVNASSRGKPLTRYRKSSNSSDWWLSKIKDYNGNKSKKVTYMASNSQIAFLQQLHSKAEQTIDIMCQRTVVYFDNVRRNYELALQLRASNDRRLHSHTDKRIKTISGINILEIKVKDDCMERMEVPTSAQFTIFTKDTQYLPIVDIRFSDFGRPDQLIGYYFEAVCFS